MIASRREAFQAHLENRQRENTLAFVNPLKTKWFYITLICVFLTTFSGLIYWQYGDKLASIFAPINQSLPEAETTQVEPGSAYSKLIGSGEPEESEIAVASNSTIQPNSQISNVELVSSPSDNEEKVGEPLKSELPEEGLLITNWESAVSSLHEATPSLAQEDNNTSEIARIDSSVTDSSGTVASNGTSNPQELAQGSQINTSDANDNVAPSSVVRTQDQESWIGENDYAIQLLAMKNESVLNEFLRENKLTQQTRIYKTRRYGGEWFVVVDKRIYTSLSQAQQARSNLPDYPGKQNAFVKRGNQILSEMSKAQN